MKTLCPKPLDESDATLMEPAVCIELDDNQFIGMVLYQLSCTGVEERWHPE